MRAPLAGTKRKDGRWQITVTLTKATGEKVRKTLYADTQGSVQEKARALIYDSGREALEDCTVGELIARYEKDELAGMSDGTKRQHRWAYPRIKAHFESRQVSALRSPALSSWLKILASEKLSGRSVQIHRDVFRVVLGYALQHGLIKTNPAMSVKLPVSAKAEQRTRLTWKDWRSIVNAEEGEIFKDYWETLGETGMRPNEALALTKSALEQVGPTWWLTVGRSKTAAGIRQIPISDELAERLSLREEFLFPTWTGSRISYDNAQRAWRLVLKKAKIAHTNLYQLRKMRLSLWVAQGVPDDVVKYLAGHTDIRLTKNIYNRVDISRVSLSLGLSGDQKSVTINEVSG